MRAGANHWHDPVEVTSNGRTLKVHTHTMGAVMWEMVLDVCMHFPGVPDYRTMDTEDIMRFYEGARPALRGATKPRSSNA